MPTFRTDRRVHFGIHKDGTAKVAPRAREINAVLGILGRQPAVYKDKPTWFVRRKSHRRRYISVAFTVDRAVVENSRRLAEYFQNQNRPVIERRQCGSALKFGVLAAGEADFYPRFGTTMEWDTAAGQAVLEAAGGHVFGLDGNRLGYGKPGLKNDGFLAWGAEPAW